MVQGFSFCPAVYQPHSSVYSGFSVVRAIYTATEPKPFTELCSGVSADFTHSSAHNTAVTQAAYAPPATHWRAYRQALHLHRYQIPPPRRTLYKSAQPPIIIRYIRGAQTMPARRGLRLSCVDRWQVLHRAHLLRGSAPPPVQGQPGGLRSDTLHPAGQSNSGRRGTIDGCRRISFRAFARCQ